MSGVRVLVLVLLFAFVAFAFYHGARAAKEPRLSRAQLKTLYDEMQPVSLKNCSFKRFGGANDGGYLLCENLVRDAKAVYSIGIGGEDNFGCQASRRYALPVQQYDCFDTRAPSCEGAPVFFHAECVGAAKETIEGRAYDSVVDFLQRNGDSGKPLLVKIDVEGAEWPSLLAVPDDVLDRIEQIAIEFHDPDDPKALELVQKLKRHFYFAHLHYNNWACRSDLAPFRARAFQALLVNKRLAVVDEAAPPPQLPRPEDAPDNPRGAECEAPR